jgi:hypothetical protein
VDRDAGELVARDFDGGFSLGVGSAPAECPDTNSTVVGGCLVGQKTEVPSERRLGQESHSAQRR